MIRLIQQTQTDPFGGIGKPEPLKHDLAGCWSKRIDQEHRLVYQVTDEKIRIFGVPLNKRELLVELVATESYMANTTLIFAKLAGLHKTLSGHLEQRNREALPVELSLDYYQRYAVLRDELRAELPELFSDLPVRETPKPEKVASDYKTKLFSVTQLQGLAGDMAYIFEVRANSELSTPIANSPRRVFISHGRCVDWREVQAYIEKDLKIDTLELAQQPNLGRTVLQKLDEESDNCSYAVVVMTGDDAVECDAPRVRENVMHEIGYFQGKFGLANVCLLHEEGVSIPTNIHGVVYIPFPKGLVSATFGVLMREIQAVMKQK